MVSIENLVKRYGDVLALDHLNLKIQKGEIFGLLGPNGSGKTTAMHCLMALLRYDKGQIRVFGEEMRPDQYENKRRIGVVLQNVAVFEVFTVEENIDYFCGLYVAEKKARQQMVEEAIAFAGLGNYRKKRAGQLSGGLLRRLNLACGMAHRPELLILDEPTVAVDPQSRNHILEGIRELNRKGTTVIYTSHYMEEIERLCTRIAILDHGRCIAKGTVEELKRMIKAGETVVLEAILLTEEQLGRIRRLPDVLQVQYQEQVLRVRFSKAGCHLLPLLGYLQKEQVVFGQVFSERPTLNDVFLELTGRELREQ
ncbi:MAG TPA: ABC transporter ATP-binding protein [Lachnospiraceae bacterium]|nr:ABC transporter ATP-binding protein [Lachnospiraceae bacterium]